MTHPGPAARAGPRASLPAMVESYATGAPYEPVLEGMPDARQAPIPLLSPVFLAYIALILGAPVAAACAAFDAAVLRRGRLAAAMLAVGAASWFAFMPIVKLLVGAGLGDLSMVLTLMRLFAIGVGVALAVKLAPHFRGHMVLGGVEVPLMHCVVAGYALALFLPNHILMLLLGVR